MEISFFSLIGQASPLAKAVLALLLLMSVSSWALMLRKWLALRAGMAKTLEGMERFDRARDLREAVQSLGGDPDSFQGSGCHGSRGGGQRAPLPPAGSEH